MFFVLSGWVLSRYIQSQERVHLIGEGMKRYVRLMLPCFASVVLIYVVMQFGDYDAHDHLLAAGSKEHTFQSYQMDLMDVVKQGLYGTVLLEDFRLNPPLWTMSVEFYGAIFIFSMSWLWGAFIRWGLIGDGGRLAAQIIIPSAMLVVATNSLTFGFFFGMLLHTITRTPQIKAALVKYRRFWMAPTMIIGVILFAYMVRGSFQSPYTSISYWGLNKLYEYAYNAIGAGLILIVVYYSPRLQAILESKPLLWLGKLSFSIYLTHYVVLMSVAVLVKSLSNETSSLLSIFLTGTAAIILTIFISVVFERFIDRPSIQLSRKVKVIAVEIGSRLLRRDAMSVQQPNNA